MDRINQLASSPALLLLLLLLVPSLLSPPGVVLGLKCPRTLPTDKGTKTPEACVFPFRYRSIYSQNLCRQTKFPSLNVSYQGKERDECIRDGSPGGRVWCSVQTYPNGTHIPNRGRWGYCDCSIDDAGQTCRTVRTFIAIDQSYPRELRGTSTMQRLGSGRSPGLPCIFPFKMLKTNEEITSCTVKAASDGIPWCSTKVDENGV